MTDLPTDTELSTLAQLGEDLYQAESEVLRLEAELKRAKRIRDAIQNEEIPEVMQDIGVLEFRTARSKFELKEILRVQPKADNRPLVLQAVEEDFRLGLSECVDALLDVADDEDVVGSANPVEDGLLDGVNVLVFVHKDIFEFFAQGRCCRIGFGQES